MASVSFPNNPSNGDTITSGGITYTYNATKGVWRDSATAVTSEVGGVTVYANTDTLPLSGVDNGSLAHVTSTNRLYIWTGTGWYNIALINQTPTIQANSYSSSYTLDNTGANTVIELVASDPEDLPITWTYTTTLTGNTATIEQSNNVFTITPSTLEADAGSFSITFKASDGVNIGTATSSFTLAFVSPYWKDVALLTGTNDTNGLQNDSFVDRSTNGHTITPTGDPFQTSFHPYLDNWSVYFDGTGDYLSIVDASMISTGEFTIEGWFYTTSTSTGQVLFHWSDISDGLDNDLYLDANGSIGCRVGSGGNTKTTSATGLWAANSWYHFAVVRNSSNNVDVYLNGTHIINHGVRTDDMDNTLEIGRNPYNGGTGYFNGYIADFRIVESALYTSNFTPPTEKLTAITNTVLLTCQSNRFIDNSSSAHTVTPVGDVAIKSFNPFGQSSVYASSENKGSVYFDGSNYVSTPSGAITIGTNDFTYEAWIYPTSHPNWGAIVGPQYNANGLVLFNQGGNLNVYGSGTRIAWSGILQLNAWQHVVLTRESGLLYLYHNGVKYGSSVGSSENLTNSLYQVGANGVGIERFYGYISDVRVTNGTAVYTSSFTAPTSPVGNTNAALYLPMDNVGIFDQTGNHILTAVGDAQTSTTQTKYATTSMYFDGTGDEILISNFTALGINDFTIEFWMNPTTTGQDGGILSDGNGDNLIVYWNGTIYARTYGTALTAAVSANTWTHVAFVRTNGGIELFINGTSSATGSSTNNLSIANLIIGRYTYNSNAYRYNGYIEDFQIINGQAKYTSNFTPPTASLSRSIQ